MAGQGVYGGQGDDEPAERGRGAVEEPGQEVRGHGLRDALGVADGEVVGGVAEDDAFLAQCLEQAAQADGELAAGAPGEVVDGGGGVGRW
ncbi:hypothetical protein GCM10028832_03850 [Streptomyces sparsus]